MSTSLQASDRGSFLDHSLWTPLLFFFRSAGVVPVDTTTIKTLYVFVEISVDRAHLAASVRLNFPACIPSSTYKGSEKGKGPALEIQVEQEPPVTEAKPEEGSLSADRPTKLAVVGTIQFVAAVQGLKADLEADAPEPEPVPERLAIEQGPSDGTSDVSPPESSQKPLQKQSQPRFEVSVPQVKPLSPGEILGCTAPRLAADTDALM